MVSPDGRQISFVRMTERGKEFLVVPALGGPERRIAASAAQQLISTPDPGMITKSFGPAWSPDGASLAIVDLPTSHEPDSVYLVSIDTGQRRRLTFPVRPGEGDSSPAFSPSGEAIAFTRSHTFGLMDLYVQRLRDRAPQRLTFDNRPIPGLTWASDGRSILFSSDRNGESRLWRVPASGGAPELIGAAGTNAYQPSVSRDGRLLAYAEFSTNINIWRYDVTKPERPERLIFSTRKNHSPAYSPDGAKLVFVSNRSGESEIWISDADGNNAMALTSLGGAMPGSPRWSPDGRKIAFDSRHEGFAAVYVIDVDGGTPRRVTESGSNCMMPGWSKDGRWIYFSSDRSGSLQIWKQPSDGGPPLQVTQSGGLDANEGSDGLYFLKNKSHGIWRMVLQRGEEAPVPGLGAVETSRHLAFTSRGIYFVNLNPARREISFFDFSSRQVKPVFNVERPLLFGTPGLTVSPDRRWIAIAEMDQATSAIMALELVSMANSKSPLKTSLSFANNQTVLKGFVCQHMGGLFN